MAFSQDFRVEALRSLGFASIGASYTAIGTPFDNSERMIFIDNLTDADLLISFDGTTDNLIIPAIGFKTFDICANQVSTVAGFFTSKFTQIYVKHNGVAPTVKAIYVQAMYGRGGQ